MFSIRSDGAARGPQAGGRGKPNVMRAAPASAWRCARAGAAALLLALPSACKKENAYVPAPPAEVGVARPVTRVVEAAIATTGTTSATNAIDLVARVPGFVQAISYQDGQQVRQGATLFTIEPAPLRVKLQQAQAALAAAQAQFQQASAEFTRQSALAHSNTSSQAKLDQARATRDADQANVAAQQANVALAAINLNYTTVTAPFDGVVSAHLVSVGDLVGVGAPTRLARLVELAPIDIDFSLAETEVQRLRAAGHLRDLSPGELAKIPVEIGLGDEAGTPHRATLDYAAPGIDAATGTLPLRAVSANADRALLPGSFVRVRIREPGSGGPALLVPETAIGAAQSGPYVLVVDGTDVVEQRSVTTGQEEGAFRVVTAGLAADDRVVVSGLTRAVPGQKVAPHEVALDHPAP